MNGPHLHAGVSGGRGGIEGGVLDVMTHETDAFFAEGLDVGRRRREPGAVKGLAGAQEPQVLVPVTFQRPRSELSNETYLVLIGGDHLEIWHCFGDVFFQTPRRFDLRP